MSKSYDRDRKNLGLVEVINILDSEQEPTQKDVTEISHAFRWIGMDVKVPHLNLTDVELKSTIDKVKKKILAKQLHKFYFISTSSNFYVRSFKMVHNSSLQ